MLWSFAGVLVLAGILMSSGARSATPADEVAFPKGFRDWFVVNSMTAGKDSPVFGHVDGMHIIHVNAKGLAALKKGGSFPYPDGTIFADDVHEFSVKDGASVEGAKKFVTVMVKDAKKYALTGGWGFQVWVEAIPRNHRSLTLPTPSKLALPAIHRKRPKTTCSPHTFREISHSPEEMNSRPDL